jgi:hypothetical protein
MRRVVLKVDEIPSGECPQFLTLHGTCLLFVAL